MVSALAIVNIDRFKDEVYVFRSRRVRKKNLKICQEQELPLNLSFEYAFDTHFLCLISLHLSLKKKQKKNCVDELNLIELMILPLL